MRPEVQDGQGESLWVTPSEVPARDRRPSHSIPGHLAAAGGSSRVEHPTSAGLAGGRYVTAPSRPPFPDPHPADMTPAERSSAVAAVLAAGLLRHLYPALFPPPAAASDSQEIPVKSTC